MLVLLHLSDLAISAVDFIKGLWGWLGLWSSALNLTLLWKWTKFWFSSINSHSLRLAIVASALASHSQAQCPDYASYSQVHCLLPLQENFNAAIN